MIPKTLRELDLSNNPNLTIEAFKMLSEKILENSSYKLERLILEGCKINDATAEVLANALEYNNHLRYFNLSRNNIMEAGAKEISLMLVQNSSLTVLFLHWNKLQPRGGQYIANALSKN